MNKSYRCRVLDSSGAAVVLTRTASSEEALARELSREGYSLVECRPTEGSALRRLSTRDILQFTEELDLLFAQSLSLKDAIRVLGTVKSSPSLASFITELEERLAKGQSMAHSLAERGLGFPPLYIGLIRVGELTGTLKSVLPQLSAYLDDRKKLRDRLFGALMYPALILCVLIGGMALLTAFVLPTFIGVADSLGAAGSAGLKERLVAFQLGFAAAALSIPLIVLLVAIARSTEAGRAVLGRIVLRLPIAGGFAMGVEMRKVCFAMETLLESGYTADVALAECAQVCGNAAVARAFSDAAAATKKGLRPSFALRETGVLPETFSSWIAVGEEAHDLRGAFKRLRRFYDREFEKASRAIMALIEPALIVAVGIVLLIVVLQFIGPIYGLLGGAL